MGTTGRGTTLCVDDLSVDDVRLQDTLRQRKHATKQLRKLLTTSEQICERSVAAYFRGRPFANLRGSSPTLYTLRKLRYASSVGAGTS
eukprot:2195935-Amphidinium_carterae.1